ncbi:M28 family metallopeptidase [Arundinibacter roseus]|uniref:M28 family peptidase n=1 Tax=Arundinibacter roseus TaxID=2070510 RepID=A0A4R4K5R6_9BACT|nr:M28 family metallopeptidase [Arundinibacter roseus]TDB61876.1 M28 family peptidase [Arundinibacter roseus]
MYKRIPKLSFLQILILLAPIVSQAQPILGFKPEDVPSQLAIEKKFDSHLKAENLRELLKKMSAFPHHVGAAFDRENAEYARDLFKSYGFEARLDTSYVLFPTPKIRVVELIAPAKFKATLTEPPLKEDATSGQTKAQLPAYHAYSADGDVTAELVYVNYGIPEDYEVLKKMGIDVKGKIVLAKYGNSWRGIKPKVAAENGAIGCIIYSDPKEDGFFQGDVYPKGAYKNETGAQRGSVLDMPLYPGDPLTPGYGATKDAPRLSHTEAPTIMKIPVLPISYGDALPLLKALGGEVAPAAWRGALPLTYHIGPGPAKVHLKLEFDWKVEPAYNVIAVLKGSEFPDQWIMRGNHHDAWVYGANDPLSGAVAVLEEARALGELVKTGWKPKRTIVYALWDAEEPGLLGSTEWVEERKEELQKKAVVYLNSDSNGRGFLYAGGSHTLEKFLNQVARDVNDPQRNISVSDRLRAKLLVDGAPKAKQEARTRTDLRIGALGSGSDYTPFIQHAGIASMNIGFGGEDGGGEYHSIYDSYDHYTRFKDTDFTYGVALAQTMGRAVMRMANAEILPFEFQNFTNTVQQYTAEIKQTMDAMRSQTLEHNQLVKENRFLAVADPKKPFVQPSPLPDVPFLNFAPLDNALSMLEKSAATYAEAVAKAGTISADKLNQLNEILYTSERFLTHPDGLPRRPWFKHQIYAPGFYTGYGVKTLPMIREAIEQENWLEAELGIVRVSDTLVRFAAQIEQANALLN